MYFYLNFYNSSLISINSTIIWCREYCYNGGEVTGYFIILSPAIFIISFRKYFMSSDNALDWIFFSKLLSKIFTKIYWALSWLIKGNQIIEIAVFNLNRISPYKITKRTFKRYLLKPINLINFFNLNYYLCTFSNFSLIPPWTQKKLLFTKHASGSPSNASVNLS